MHLSEDEKRATMRQIAPVFGPVIDKDPAAAAIALRAEDIIAPPQFVSTGLPFIITSLRDCVAMSCAVLKATAIEAMNESLGKHGTDVMEPFLATLDGFTETGDMFLRLLLYHPAPQKIRLQGPQQGRWQVICGHIA